MGTHPIFESDFDCLTECHVLSNVTTQSSSHGHWTILGHLLSISMPLGVAHVVKWPQYSIHYQNNFLISRFLVLILTRLKIRQLNLVFDQCQHLCLWKGPMWLTKWAEWIKTSSKKNVENMEHQKRANRE